MARRLWQSGLSIGLLSIIAVSLISSLDEAKWLNDRTPLLALAVLGFGYGSILPFTHFRARTAAISTGLLSLAVTALIIGRVLPSPQTITTWPFSDSLWLAHVRLLTLFDQLNAGLQATLHGDFDRTLHAFLIGWLTWISGVWLIWSVVRRRQALQGIVPCALVLAINIVLNGRDVSFPMLFTTSAVILIARTAFTHRIHDWETRQIDYPELITEDWTMSAAIIAALVFVLVMISTPESRRSLNDFFVALQPPAAPRPDQGSSSQ